MSEDELSQTTYYHFASEVRVIRLGAPENISVDSCQNMHSRTMGPKEINALDLFASMDTEPTLGLLERSIRVSLALECPIGWQHNHVWLGAEGYSPPCCLRTRKRRESENKVQIAFNLFQISVGFSGSQMFNATSAVRFGASEISKFLKCSELIVLTKRACHNQRQKQKQQQKQQANKRTKSTNN